MNITLVNPRYSEFYGRFSEAKEMTSSSPPPLGLEYIAAMLEIEGYNVKIIDAEVEKLTVEETVKKIRHTKPDIIGFTATTPVIKRAHKISILLKEENPDLISIVGGPHPTALPKETLKAFDSFDYVVKGEGEYTTTELLKNIENKIEIGDIQGIAFRKEGEIVETPNRPFINPLDDLPFPARHLIDRSKYIIETVHGEHGRFETIQTSRGCPFKCIFCYPVLGNKVRYRLPENVLSELKILKEKYKTDVVGFVDDTWTLNIKRAKEICDLIIKEGIDIEWGCTTRVDLIDRELLEKMKKAGCVRVNFGVESGDPEILKIIKKRITIDQAKKAFKMTKEVGIETVAYFILGHPYETLESIKKTIKLAKTLNPDVAEFSIMTPFPKTELDEMIRRGEGNMRILSDDWEQYTHYGNAVISVGIFSDKNLLEWQKKAFRSFYLRPSYAIPKLLKTVKNQKELISLIKAGYNTLLRGH